MYKHKFKIQPIEPGQCGILPTPYTPLPPPTVPTSCDEGGSVILDGDVTGLSTNTTVEKIQNNLVEAGLPVNNAVLIYDTSLNRYDVRQLSIGDLVPVFSIDFFSGGISVECGIIVTNPTFTAGYSSLPTSANITNTDSINSPLTLISPFTSATVNGSFTHSLVNSSVVFTLMATLGTATSVATQSISYLARSFGGVGIAGATGATASGNNAILNSSLGNLVNQGLHISDIGENYGPFSPTNQKIYLILPHTGTPHTFKDQNGFSFVMNAPLTFSFINQNNATITMDIYESVLNLSTSFTITVTS